MHQYQLNEPKIIELYENPLGHFYWLLRTAHVNPCSIFVQNPFQFCSIELEWNGNRTKSRWFDPNYCSASVWRSIDFHSFAWYYDFFSNRCWIALGTNHSICAKTTFCCIVRKHSKKNAVIGPFYDILRAKEKLLQFSENKNSPRKKTRLKEGAPFLRIQFYDENYKRFFFFFRLCIFHFAKSD